MTHFKLAKAAILTMGSWFRMVWQRGGGLPLQHSHLHFATGRHIDYCEICRERAQNLMGEKEKRKKNTARVCNSRPPCLHGTREGNVSTYDSANGTTHSNTEAG